MAYGARPARVCCAAPRHHTPTGSSRARGRQRTARRAGHESSSWRSTAPPPGETRPDLIPRPVLLSADDRHPVSDCEPCSARLQLGRVRGDRLPSSTRRRASTCCSWPDANAALHGVRRRRRPRPSASPAGCVVHTPAARRSATAGAPRRLERGVRARSSVGRRRLYLLRLVDRHAARGTGRPRAMPLRTAVATPVRSAEAWLRAVPRQGVLTNVLNPEGRALLPRPACRGSRASRRRAEARSPSSSSAPGSSAQGATSS